MMHLLFLTQNNAIFTPQRIAFRVFSKCHKLDKVVHSDLTSCRSGLPRGFGGPNPSPNSWKLFTYVLVDSSSRSHLYFIYFRPGPNICSHCTKVWHRSYPTCDAPLSRSARRSFAPCRNRSKITVLKCEQKLYTVWFVCRRKSYADLV